MPPLSLLLKKLVFSRHGGVWNDVWEELLPDPTGNSDYILDHMLDVMYILINNSPS